MRIHHGLMVAVAAGLALASSSSNAGIVYQVSPAKGTGFDYKLQVLGGSAVDLCTDHASTRLVLNKLGGASPLFTTAGCRQLPGGEFQFTLKGNVGGTDQARLVVALSDVTKDLLH